MELMSETSLLAEILSIVRTLGRVQPHVLVTAESRLVDDLAIDSLDLVNVLLRIQDQFDVVIDDEDVPNLHRVVDLAQYVASHRESAAA
jgi:acyl carrier protein